MDLSAATDQQLVAWARAGRDDALREIMRRYELKVLAIIKRKVRNLERAQDLTQETFVKALEALQTQRPESEFRKWLFQIARNTTTDYIRRPRIETVALYPTNHTPPPREPEPGNQAAERYPSSPRRKVAKKLHPVLLRAIHKLRPEYRDCALLRLVKGLSYKEIAGRLDLPEGTVATYLRRANKELQDKLGPDLKAAQAEFDT